MAEMLFCYGCARRHPVAYKLMIAQLRASHRLHQRLIPVWNMGDSERRDTAEPPYKHALPPHTTGCLFGAWLARQIPVSGAYNQPPILWDGSGLFRRIQANRTASTLLA